MRLRIELASAPPAEDCAQTGAENYEELARAECSRYTDLLRKKLGREPAGAKLTTDQLRHDFGPYYEVVCVYDSEDREAVAYAYACESNGPRTWDDDEPFDWRSALDEEPPPARGLSPETVGHARPF